MPTRNQRNQMARNDELFRNKKVVIVENLKDNTIFESMVVRSRSQNEGRQRKEHIRAAFALQDYLPCQVENLVAIICNKGDYHTWRTVSEKRGVELCIRWQLLSMRDTGAIRIE